MKKNKGIEMQEPNPGRKSLWLSAAALLTMSVGTSAADFAFETTAGIGQSDNVGRLADNEQEETIANLGLLFSVDEHTRRLDADVVGNLGYYDYLDDTFDSELLGNMAANLRVGLVEERVYWLVADNFGQVLIDPFTPATPANRENINYFSTGPRAQFTLGGAMLLTAGARYSKTSYEDSPFDSTGLLAELGVGRALSSSSELTLNARAMQVEYDESALNGDYDQNELFLRYDATGSRTRLTLDAGHSQIDQDAASGSESELLLRLQVARRLSSRSMATLNAGQEYSGSGSTFAAQQSGSPIGLESASGRQTIDPFTSRYAGLGWDYTAGRMGALVSVSWRDEQYELNPLLDQTITVFGVGMHREMSPQLRLSLDANLRSGSFELPGGDYDDLGVRAALDWRMTRRVALRLSYEHANRDSDLAAANYTENRIWLSIGYGRGAPRDSLQSSFERGRNPEAQE